MTWSSLRPPSGSFADVCSPSPSLPWRGESPPLARSDAPWSPSALPNLPLPLGNPHHSELPGKRRTKGRRGGQGEGRKLLPGTYNPASAAWPYPVHLRSVGGDTGAKGPDRKGQRAGNEKRRGGEREVRRVRGLEAAE